MILAFTGAGISKASGILTFEEQKDLRDKLSHGFKQLYRKEYNELIQGMQEICNKAKPNDAHIALAEYNVPIITMNIDGLHKRAGSKHVLEIHGRLPKIVLYGEYAHNYDKAIKMVGKLREGDIFLIVGVSFHTNIAYYLKEFAERKKVETIIINSQAEVLLRPFLESNKSKIEGYRKFMERI